MDVLHVAVHAALVLAAMRAVGALQVGFLAALHVEVLLEVALPAVHLTAARALEAARGLAGGRLAQLAQHGVGRDAVRQRRQVGQVGQLQGRLALLAVLTGQRPGRQDARALSPLLVLIAPLI